MSVPANRKYTKDHEWVKEEGGLCRVGITDYAQKELGDVVFVELPQVGRQVKQGESLSTIESVKAVSDVYAPIDGKVSEVNGPLSDAPDNINKDPYEGAWMIVIEPTNKAQLGALMDSGAYAAYLSEISK